LSTSSHHWRKPREHILWAAKDVFIEMGFERASMDMVAARAVTSKRSLYAHFESKDKLFLAVVDLVRELRTCRLGIAEAKRLPEASAQYYDAIFHTTHERLAAFLSERCQLAPPASINIAHELLGRTVYPQLFRALLGVEEPLNELPDEASIAADLDLAPIRRAVAALLPSEEAGTP
jgi:AcrR family transcriptional regulator